MKRQALVDSSARNVRPRVVSESTGSLYNRLRQQRREIGERRLHINEENPLNYYARMIDVPAGSHSIDRRLGTTVGGYYLEPNITDHINSYLGPNEANIQGIPQAPPNLVSPNNEHFLDYHWMNQHGHGTIQPAGTIAMFFDEADRYFIDGPPPSRGPGGRNR